MAAGALLALSSCSLLFSPDNLGDPDGGVSPPPMPPDARPLEPGEFGVSSVEPFTLTEGAGTAWAVPVLVRGQEFTDEVTVLLDGAGFDQQVITPVVATDGKSLAFPLRVPVLTGTRAGENETLSISVRKGGLTAAAEITVTGLDELVTSQLGAGPFDAADFDQVYSRIVIDEDITLTGAAAIRLKATAEIQLAASVLADGQNAIDGANDTEDLPGQGGPGGCPGGDREANGACGTGGGRGAVGDDAAAGGGHFTIGTPGSGEPAAPGGLATGRRELVPLEDEAGNGGGGSRKGAGGGGGGIVELTSEGTFVVEATGLVSANGGRGGQGTCNASLKAGSGGGGSGGTILVRAWGGFDDKGDGPRLLVRGGQGGAMPPNDNCVEVGGAGSFGRVRFDTSEPGGAPPFARTEPEAYQGPLFRNIDSSSNPVAVVTRQTQVTLEVFGDRSTGFSLEVNGQPQSFSTSSDGSASVLVTLAPGSNQICTKIDRDTPLQVSEGVQCIRIVSIQ